MNLLYSIYPINLSSSAQAIASLVPDDQLSEDNIMPEAFDPKVVEAVSQAVKAHIS